MTNLLFAKSELWDLIELVEKGDRLGFTDGVRLFKSTDLLAIGYMADLVRRRKNGERVWFSWGHKISADQWVETKRKANSLEVQPHAAMFYDSETVEAMVEHLLRLRERQDETGGFLSFAPIVGQRDGFKPAEPTTGFNDLKVLAVARILLDNFQHIRAYCLQTGVKLAQVALSFGVDDLDTMVVTENGNGSTWAVSKDYLVSMIKVAQRKPVERDELYKVIQEY